MSAKPENEAVNVRILDRDYTIGVAPGERAGLIEAARLLDEQMREIRQHNRIAPIERVAVLAALNLAHELQDLRTRQKNRDQHLQRSLDALEVQLALLEKR